MIGSALAVVSAALPGVPVATKVPNPLPGRCVRVSRIGGYRRRELDAMRILVECYASTAAGGPDGPRAEADAYAAWDALRAAADGGPWADRYITGFDGDSLADFPDVDVQDSHARWQFSGTLYLI